MADMQKSKKKDTRIRFSSAFKDMVVIIAVTILVFILSYFFNVFIFLVRWFQEYPGAIFYIDEIITVLLTLAIGFAVFSWRRWKELKKETAERIKLQEELVKCANTETEIERIIRKQLQVEIEERKKEDKKYTPHPHKGKTI